MRVRSHVQDVRGRLQRNVKLLGMNPIYYLGAVGIVGGFMGAIWAIAQDLTNAQGPALIISGLGAAALVGQTVRDGLELAAERRHLYIVARQSWATEGQIGLPAEYTAAGYRSEPVAGQQVVRSEAVDRTLLSSDIALVVDPVPFLLVNEARRIGPLVLTSSFRRGMVLYNAPKARLASDLLDTSRSATIQRTDYYSSLCTNEATGKVVRSRVQIQPVYDGWAMVEDGGELFPLDGSPCSNHVGMSSLAITRDRQMLVTLQSGRAAQNADLLVPAASGSADWSDVAGRPTLQAFLRGAMERELIEECGLRELPDLRLRTLVIGYARLIRRGGKPEFFGLTLVDAESSQLERVTEEVGLTSQHLLVSLGADDYRQADYARIAMGLRAGHQLSVQLELALDCIRRACSELPSFRESQT